MYDRVTVLRTDTPTDRPLRHPSAARLGVGNDRHDNRRFLFSPVRYPFQQHFADFRRPEQFTDFPLGHGGCAYIGRQGDIAVFIYRDDIPFFFHRYAVLR